MVEYKLAGKGEQHGNIIGYQPQSETLVWMKPIDFLLAAPQQPFYSREYIDPLKEKMQQGVPLDALFLDMTTDCEVTGHEGRHRAIAADELEIEKVPVVIYCKEKDPDSRWRTFFTDASECQKCPIITRNK